MLNIGMTGLGGFAGKMFDHLLAIDPTADPNVRVRIVCEPAPHLFPHRVDMAKQHGIRLVTDFADLLCEPVEMVYLPLPIPLHRPFTEEALRAAKAVLCEKPAAGSVGDVDAMIAVRDRAKRPVAIGFNHIYQKAVWEIKRRLCDGEFGKVIQASVIGCWPRGDSYYRRASWAGKLRHEGRWVLDTPANNAFSHYIHLALFLMGESVGESARPATIEAETYRVNPIETHDTCSLRITLHDGVPIVVGLTHACATSVDPEVTIVMERGEIRYRSGGDIEVPRHDESEHLSMVEPMHVPMFRNFCDLLQGGPGASEVGTLEMAKAQTLVAAAASEAGEVVEIGAEFSRVIHDEEGKLTVITGIEDLIRNCVDRGQLLDESGLANWTRPGKSISLAD